MTKRSLSHHASRRRDRTAAWLVLAHCAVLMACQGPGPLTVGDAILAPLTLGGAPVPAHASDAPVVPIVLGQTPTIPNAPVVQLAIDHQVPWVMVKDILAQMERAGQTPILLVAEKRKLRTFHINDPLAGPPIEALGYADGQLCVRLPIHTDAKCSKPRFMKHIDAAYTRELVREAVNEYERAEVLVRLPKSAVWLDVVSAVGGARSCCAPRPVSVALGE